MCGSFYEETLERLSGYEADTVEPNYLEEGSGVDVYAELVFTVENAESHAAKLNDLVERLAVYLEIVATPRIFADGDRLIIGLNAAEALPIDTSDEFYQAVRDAVASGNEYCEE